MKPSMKFTERLIERLGGVTKTALADLQSRAYESGYQDANDEPPSGTLKSYSYRRATTGSLRDFTRMSHDDILATAWSLWQSSPIAKRVIRIKRGYVLGGGVSPQTQDEDLQQLLDAFWEDNQLPRRQREFVDQLFLLGEQCYPVFVRKSDGKVSLGYVDPGEIEAVIMHPGNAMEAWAVVVKAQQIAPAWGQTHEKQVFRIVRKDVESISGEQVIPPQHPGMWVLAEQATLEPWEAQLLQSYGLSEYSGSCFFDKVNSLSNQPRGYPDLTQVADWIDQADETLFALAEREQMAGYFSFDVTLTGANDDQVKLRSKQIREKPPKKGSVNVHNDAEAWQMWAPDLNQAGTIETFNALVTLILGGMGFPRHWFGYGDETNRATAEAQGDPTWRSLEDDQGQVEQLLTVMCEFVRDQAIIAGRLPESKEQEIEIPMPEMTAKDFTKLMAQLSPLALGLTAAQDAKWITQETAAKAWARAMSEIGVEVDVSTELEAVEAEQAEQEEADAEEQNAQLMARMAALEQGAPAQLARNGNQMDEEINFADA